MNFFQRAIRSVARQKSKSMILFAVVFLLGNILAGSVIIQQSTQQVEQKTKAQMGAIATIGIDWNDSQIQKSMEDGTQVNDKDLDEKLIKKIAASPYVKSYDYSEQAGFESQVLKPYDPAADKKADKKEGADQGVTTYLPIRGVQDPNIMDISLGKIKLVAGNVFTADEIKNGTNVVLISNKFADKNGLHVGDELTIDQSVLKLSHIDEADAQNKRKTFDTKFKVVGTYEVLEPVQKKSGQSTKAANDHVVHAASFGGNSQQEMFDFENYNTIYTPNKAVHTMNQGYMKFLMAEQPEIMANMSDEEKAVASKPYYTPIFQLNSIDDLKKFKADTKPLIPKLLSVQTMSDEFDTVAGQFKKLSKIAQAVIVAAVILSVVLILLVILLFMRDRKRELGIYLSLGDKKSTIILQIMVEVLAVASVALVLSLITGKFLGGFASESFLSSTGSQSVDKEMIGGGMMGTSAIFSTGTVVNAETIADNYTVSFTPFYIVTYLLAGLGTVILSVLLSTLYIFKLKPKKILLG
ncbi:MAG: ABC transporter permease [Streptococcaceae bacterium]|jgi:putative ABC transport system permease protein|nr:ABC transporter permease [Streptococcaceae bacterium]